MTDTILTFNGLLVCGYWWVVACLIWVAHHHLHDVWRRAERSRTTVGVLCVMLPAVALVGLEAWQALGVVFIGFGIAGALTVALDNFSDSKSIQEAQNLWVRD